MEESEGGGDIQGDGDRTLGDADSSCCEDENRPTEVKKILMEYLLQLHIIFMLY